MQNKDLKKQKNKKYMRVSIVFSAREKALLESMMQSEEWTNRAGFIKNRIFGDSIDSKYEKMLESGDDSDRETILISLMTEMNREIDYVNYRFDHELAELKKAEKEVDEKTFLKWISILKNWKASLESRTDRIFSDSRKILQSLNVKYERQRFDDLTSLPDYYLEQFAKDWELANSPEGLEYVRRLHERDEARRKELMEKRLKEEKYKG